ncbi:MAG: hypothetical protein O3C21_21255, partial [Verrucomicrobia bacterium]|nr:hypothetical protein [Verrucomicrobiota bacterium]
MTNPFPTQLMTLRRRIVVLFVATGLFPLIGSGQEPLPTTPIPDSPQTGDEASVEPGQPFSQELQPPPAPPPASAQAVTELDPRPAVSPPPPAVQNGITAMEALRRLGERFGDEPLALIVEMKGLDGQTQPSNWIV